MSTPDDQKAARREMTGANSEHGASHDGTERLDEEGRGGAETTTRGEMLDEVKEKAGEAWESAKERAGDLKDRVDDMLDRDDVQEQGDSEVDVQERAPQPGSTPSGQKTTA
jgi:hypothetical protein